MRFNKEQKKQMSDFFEKFALAIATATAVRLLFDVSATPEWIYLLAAVVIIFMLVLSMALLRDVNDDVVVKTENNNKRNKRIKRR